MPGAGTGALSASAILAAFPCEARLPGCPRLHDHDIGTRGGQAIGTGEADHASADDDDPLAHPRSRCRLSYNLQ